MMKNKLNIAGSFLFVLNVFVLFLLLFESKLLVPLWLRPFGRMHPMILHFPIVLLLLSMLMEFFRFRKEISGQEFYQKFTTFLLLAGLISSGIVVMMGLFLSQEEGYSSDMLARHKWFGVSIFLIGSIIYACRNSKWYNEWIAKVAAVVIALCVILSGHYGAALTHGDNFIWQPVMTTNNIVVPMEDAKIFDHVIRPVFERKCTGCHNPDKQKGKLLLIDSAAIAKGGKSGKLFNLEKPESSLLIKRIHLPLDHKKHMPPSGKAQLSEDEVLLLDLWMKGGAKFNKKVVSLHPNDSLRILAEKLNDNNKSKEEVFHFAAADGRILEKLNTNYRVISPLSQGSPALAVNIYNRDAYESKTLDELDAVSLQIVSLQLSKMPVTDSDLKRIAGFENLRRLDLNFTDITGKGLMELTSLRSLRNLSLSGTKVQYDQLYQALPLFKSLNTVTIWDTGLSDTEIKQLRSVNRNVEIVTGFRDDGTNPIKLNLPKVKNKQIVFRDSLSLQLFHPIKNVEIRFTTDGSDPDSLTSLIFKPGIILKESTAIKAKAYKAGWLSSDVASLSVYRSAYVPDTIILASKLSRVHPANGALTFFDHQLGSFNANSPAWANNWAGFIKNDMELLLEFKDSKVMSSMSMNCLVETETSIFPPASIEVWGGSSGNAMKLIARMKPDMPGNYRKPFITLVNCTFDPQKIAYLKIIAKPVMKMPGWHKSRDKPALLLVDEIFLN